MSYYGLPVLKPPVWTWEVPAYFFVGGAAGAAAVIGAVAFPQHAPGLQGAEPDVGGCVDAGGVLQRRSGIRLRRRRRPLESRANPHTRRPHRSRSQNYLAMGAAAVEFAVGLSLERDPAEVPERPDRLAQAGAMMSGPVPLAIRLIAGRSLRARRVAALATLTGSILTRVGWLEAGRASALASRP
jgi:hypothetical protein